MSALQVTRAVLAALAAPATFKRGLFMARRADGGLPPPPPRKDFRGAYAVVFVDASGWLNMAAHVSGSALAQARPAARPGPPGRLGAPTALPCGAARDPPLPAGASSLTSSSASPSQHRACQGRGDRSGA